VTAGAAALVDSSVLVAALVEDEPRHEACLQVFEGKLLYAWNHALAETFATLTGGRLGIRVPPDLAVELIESSLLPRLRLVELPSGDLLKALRRTDAAGVRGGALYDFLHLVAAQKVRAEVLYTLNVRHFAALSGKGDPRIESPA